MAPLLLSLGGRHSKRTEKSPLSAYWVGNYRVIIRLTTSRCNLCPHFTASPQPTQPNATTHVGVQAGSDKQSLPDKIGTLQIQSLHEVHWPFITLNFQSTQH